MKINFKSGQLVLESLIAIGITSLVLISLLAAITRGVKNTSNAAQISQASSYAREGIEIARKARDRATDWQDFLDKYNSNMGLAKTDLLPTGSCPVIANIDNIFIRCVDFSNTTDKSTVTVTVSWQESGGTRQVQATTFLTDWSR